MSVPKILIVEDDKWLAQQHARILNGAGYKPTVTLNAIEAIQSVDDEVPDAIILDVLLTGNTAFALMHELQSYGDTGEIPIILCTNLAADLSLDDLAPYGVRQIIDKATMVPDDIVTALRRVLL
ncbi:MAG: response regulator [Candidatus Saccharibacteria bacterium]